MSTLERIETVWTAENLGPWHGRVTVDRTRVRRGRQTTSPSDWLITVNARWTGPSGPAFPAAAGPVNAADCVTVPTVLEGVKVAQHAAAELRAGRTPRLRRASVG